MPNKPGRFLVCEELKILTDERRNFIIDSPIFSVAAFFIYKQAVQKAILRIEGQEASSMRLCVMSRGAYTSEWVVSVYPMEKCLPHRIIALLVHWTVCFMPSCVVETLFSNFHIVWT